MSYDLWYWPNIPGRGEFVRLFMEAAGIDYRDRAREADAQALIGDLERRKGIRPFAPPYLVDESGLAIAQVAHILAWLSDRHDLGSGDPATDLQLIMLQLTITDIVAEAHDTHHPVSASAYFEDQKDAAKRAAKVFREERIPKYLDYFEDALSAHEGPFVLGRRWSHVDTSLFQLIEGLHYAFPKRTKTLKGRYPRLYENLAAVTLLDEVGQYLGSDRRLDFNTDGIFRHYPELDEA